RTVRPRSAPRRHDHRRARHRLVEARPARAAARPGRLRPAHADQADVRPEEPAEPGQEALTRRRPARELPFRTSLDEAVLVVRPTRSACDLPSTPAPCYRTSRRRTAPLGHGWSRRALWSDHVRDRLPAAVSSRLL